MCETMSKMSTLTTYMAGDRKADCSKNVDNVGALVMNLFGAQITLK